MSTPCPQQRAGRQDPRSQRAFQLLATRGAEIALAGAADALMAALFTFPLALARGALPGGPLL